MDKFTSRAITVCLLLLAFAAPISIAATQTAWALGLLFWIIRSIFVRPRPKVERLDIAVFAFVGLTLISSLFSYEPAVSLRKMVAVSLVTIVYLVATNLSRPTFSTMLVLILAGCTIACTFTFAKLAIGNNLKVLKLTTDSPLRSFGVEENDTILSANGRDIQSPYDLAVELYIPPPTNARSITVYRHELINTYKLPEGFAIPDPNIDHLGIVEWSYGRDTRASGFFGHYTTFAEALQLLGSLCLALLIVVPGSLLSRNRVLLGIVLVAAVGGLFLSLTRASWVSFVISSAVIVLIAASRRTVLICAGIAVPLIIGGLVFLQQKRNVSFIDSKDGSTTWRTMVWKEAANVMVSDPRHLIVGVGMDSIKTQWSRWQMFDNGRQPIGHLHNDYLQIAFERGIPTLIAWLAWMAFYLLLLWKNIRHGNFDWPARGLLIGAFGGTIGFLVSGLVHYNWGDSEVVMIFYLIMGMSLAVVRTGNDSDRGVSHEVSL